MDGERKENSVGDGESCSRSEIVESAVDGGARANGSAIDMGIGSSPLRSSLLTYRRRKNVKVVENGMFCDDSGNEFADKSINDSSDQVNQKMSHAVSNGSRNFSLKRQRDIVLEQICQSSEIEHGLEKCIQAALAFHPGSVSRTTVKETIHSCEAGSKSTVHMAVEHHGFEDAPKSNMSMRSNASTKGSNHDAITELCQKTLFDIITSENFAQLCNLLIENGMKAEKLFDLSDINSRMKERAYESSPIQFHSDIQQIWAKLQMVGAEMIALSKFLSDKTMSSFREQVGSFAQSASDNGGHEFPTQESEMHIADLTEACTLGEVHKCRHCRETLDGGNALVCDSCEEMYHISCIEPAVEEIPPSSWYCTMCTANGVESPHDECVACERLNSSRSPFDGHEEDNLMCEVTPRKLEESSTELDRTEGDGRFSCCKVCQTNVKIDEDYRICGHSFCLHKFYHVRCLTSKQLESYGPCWYCPSCLCRACFIDQDDDKIVLCDCCDHAYHIYCMQPPRTTIPKGKWFCTKCQAGLERLHRAKRRYDGTQIKSRKRFLGGESIEGAISTSGGVDMLLNAAKTLNYEENLATMEWQAK